MKTGAFLLGVFKPFLERLSGRVEYGTGEGLKVAKIGVFVANRANFPLVVRPFNQ